MQTEQNRAAGERTQWTPVVYGRVGNEICRVSEWVAYYPNSSPKRFTLHPLNGSAPHCGLVEGEFVRYSEEQNIEVRKMLHDEPDFSKDDDCHISDEAWSQ